MKEDLKDKTLLYVDGGGNFFSFALKLAESYKTVYYFTHWQTAYPTIENAVVGSEWEDGEMKDEFDELPLVRIKNLYDYVDRADIIVFPDVLQGAMAEHFRSLGKPVFGSFHGEELEADREGAGHYFKKKGLAVAPSKRIIGVEALKKHLEKAKGVKFIKISSYRNITETFKHEDYNFTEIKLDKLAHKLGALKSVVEFLVEDEIPEATESGYDGFTVSGEYPDKAMQGVEIKDQAYCGECVEYKSMNEGVLQVNEAMVEFLKETKYNGAISTELRSTKDGKHYPIDICARLGSPPSEVYQELFSDIGMIVWEIANGRMPEIKPVKPFGMQLVLNIDWQGEVPSHTPIWFPEEIRGNVKLKNPIKIDGNYYSLVIDGISTLGSIVAIGDSLEECKKELERIFPLIKYPNANVDLKVLVKCIEEYGKVSKGS